jgi:hypothetical protein
MHCSRERFASGLSETSCMQGDYQAHPAAQNPFRGDCVVRRARLSNVPLIERLRRSYMPLRLPGHR